MKLPATVRLTAVVAEVMATATVVTGTVVTVTVLAATDALVDPVAVSNLNCDAGLLVDGAGVE